MKSPNLPHPSKHASEPCKRRFGKHSNVSKLNACVNSKRASPNNVCN